MSSKSIAQKPYEGIPPEEWLVKTLELVRAHPLSTDDFVEATLNAWKSIFTSSIGGLHIGEDIFPSPQIMGGFLHELIPYQLAAKYPGEWRREKEAGEKDLVAIQQSEFSTEIKTSSNPRNIYGNRSYAQPDQGTGKKGNSGFYLTVNFQKFTDAKSRPEIIRVRLGWLDHTDWVPQGAATGQQASLTRDARAFKLVELYPERHVDLR